MVRSSAPRPRCALGVTSDTPGPARPARPALPRPAPLRWRPGLGAWPGALWVNHTASALPPRGLARGARVEAGREAGSSKAQLGPRLEAGGRAGGWREHGQQEGSRGCALPWRAAGVGRLAWALLSSLFYPFGLPHGLGDARKGRSWSRG